MSDLVVIVYPTEAKAEEMRQKILGLQKEYLIEIGDAVIAVKHDDGTVKLNQLFNTTAAGTATGGLWGLLVGLIFLNPILGVALGAASGALAGALSDYGINDDFIKQLSVSLQPGNAALFLLIKKFTADKVLEALKGTGERFSKRLSTTARKRRCARQSPPTSDPSLGQRIGRRRLEFPGGRRCRAREASTREPALSGLFYVDRPHSAAHFDALENRGQRILDS